MSYNALTYIVVAVAITALDAREALRAEVRENQLETQLALAQFTRWAQLHPHFLFQRAQRGRR